jgi:transcriptional regulator of stress and heat shock response
MARLSDAIEQFIKALLKENRESEIQIQRNELANYFSCAPSQINYVLTTRFTVDRGYYIESRRGGGGYIVIRRVEQDMRNSLAKIVTEGIGDNITYERGLRIISGLVDSSIVTEREAEIIKASINDRALSIYADRNRLRADILKSIITVILM